MSNFVSHRARFRGELSGIKIADLKGLDYEKTTLKDRMKEVEGKLEEVMPFFNEYFFQKENDERDNGEFEHLKTENDEREFYRYCPNKTDELSEDINICQYIQAYASYILNSKDLPREKQQEYKILTEDRFKKILERERVMSSMNTSDEDEDLAGFAVEQIILDTRPTNDYNNLDLNIDKLDFKKEGYINNRPSKEEKKYYTNIKPSVNKEELNERNDWLIATLNSYVTMQEYLKKEMNNIKCGEYSKYALFQLVGLMSDIKKDMIDAKKQLGGIRNQAKRLGDENPMNDYSELDYKNEEHIKLLLKYCRITKTPRPDDMMSHMGYDLHCTIQNLVNAERLDKIDLEIIECYNAGYSEREIAKEINRGTTTVQQRLNKICKRISLNI